MHTAVVRRKTPWLDMPLVLSGNYREYMCMLDEAWQCEYQEGYWRFWYEADHRYALPTVAFLLSVIIVFAIVYFAANVLPRRALQTRLATKSRAVFRYLSYKTISVAPLKWNSAPLGVLILAAVGIVFFFTMTLGPKPYYWPTTDGADYGSSPPIATRAGWMGLACMPFVFATAGKANLITMCTGVSHERLQVFHRWIAYAFFVLALIHTFPFIVYNYQMDMMTDMWNETVFYWTGVVALVAQAWLTFASLSPLRNWCYEWFKFSHFVAALVFVLFFFFHCDATLTAWDYFVATGVLFSLSWLYRQIRIYFEHGISHRAELSRASNGFVRVSIPTQATWGVGQHYFIRFMTLGMHSWTVHPFSACSLPSQDKAGLKQTSELVFFIKPRGGFTSRLAAFVDSHPDARVRVLIDGPYGGVKSQAITDSQRLLVIVGGSGAGWALPFVTAFVRKLSQEPSSVDGDSHPSLRIVLATRDIASVKWFEQQVQQVLSSLSAARIPSLEVDIHYTGSPVSENSSNPGRLSNSGGDPEKTLELAHSRVEPLSDSEASQIRPSGEIQRAQHLKSRPNLPNIISKEAMSVARGQKMGVFVCGPSSMQVDVSNVVAQEQLSVAASGSGDIYLHLEHFSWA